MQNDAAIRAFITRSRRSMVAASVCSLGALALLLLFMPVLGESRSGRVFAEFVLVGFGITFLMGICGGVVFSAVSMIMNGRARRGVLLGMLEKGGRAHLTLRPSGAMLAASALRLGLSVALQWLAVLHLQGPRVSKFDYGLGAIAMFGGLWMLLSGMRLAGDYFHVRDARADAMWLKHRQPGVRQ